MNNKETYNLAKSYLGQGGATFRKFCGLPSGAAWCNAFVSYIFAKSGNASLYCGGKKQTYCPTSIKLCKKDMAMIPMYLAMPMDVIYFDWDKNGVPNHIGFVRAHNTCDSIYTIEGNTSNKVMNKTRPAKYVCGIFRPHYKASFTLKKLAVDGDCGYNTIAGLQKALGGCTVDGILGIATVKRLQHYLAITEDGQWGKSTSKAVQKLIGAKQDGAFGPASVKALQTWINKKVYPSSSQEVTPSTNAQKAVAWARSIAKGGQYTYKKWNSKDKKTKQCPICHKLTGKYKGFNCIGFVSCAYHHGSGMKNISCAMNGIGTDNFFTKVTLASWTKRNGKGWTMIGSGSKGGADIPASKLAAGDVVVCYDGSGKFHHLVLYSGNGKYIDCTNTTKPHIGERNYSNLCSKYHCTRAFRYTG